MSETIIADFLKINQTVSYYLLIFFILLFRKLLNFLFPKNILKFSLFISTKSIFAPQFIIQFADETKVLGVVQA